MPVIGFLHPTSLEAFAQNLRGFRQGLKETGYVEGRVELLHHLANFLGYCLR